MASANVPIMFRGRILGPHVVNALAWACVLQWPWGGTLFPALTVLAVLHLAQPLWSSWVDKERPLHRAFAAGPLLMFATDTAFLVAAWKRDCWGDLTVAFVPVLVVVALIALLYSAAVMTFLGRRQRSDTPPD